MRIWDGALHLCSWMGSTAAALDMRQLSFAESPIGQKTMNAVSEVINTYDGNRAILPSAGCWYIVICDCFDVWTKHA